MEHGIRDVPYTPIYSDYSANLGENVNNDFFNSSDISSMSFGDLSTKSNYGVYLEKLKKIKPQICSVLGGKILLSFV